MLRTSQFCRTVLDANRFQTAVATWIRGYNKEYENAQLKVTFPDIHEFQRRDENRQRFKDHRTRLESEWKENRNQGTDPLLERMKFDVKKEATVDSALLQDFSSLTGIPKHKISGREARIFSPARNAMQSGSFATRKWRIQFDNMERWENPNMGWTSTSDPLSGLHIEFTSPEEAIAYCKRMGYPYFVEERQVPKLKPKSYAANFAWNKNTRVPAK